MKTEHIPFFSHFGELGLARTKHQIELKLPFPRNLAIEYRQKLEILFSPDPHHSEYQVTTQYWDTFARSLNRENMDSLPFRTKIRLRSYANWDAKDTCFLEIKQRDGLNRKKWRSAIEHSKTDLAEKMGRLALMPSLICNYRRSRFIDPKNGVSITFDDQLCFSSPEGKRFSETFSEFCVVEVKAESLDECTPVISALSGLKIMRFSKYRSGCSALKKPVHF